MVNMRHNLYLDPSIAIVSLKMDLTVKDYSYTSRSSFINSCLSFLIFALSLQLFAITQIDRFIFFEQNEPNLFNLPS